MNNKQSEIKDGVRAAIDNYLQRKGKRPHSRLDAIGRRIDRVAAEVKAARKQILGPSMLRSLPVATKPMMTRAAPGDQKRVLSWIASTSDLDRHGSRIMPGGLRTENFDKNPVFLWGHDGYGGSGRIPDPENIIGRVVQHQTNARSFQVKVEYLDTEVAQRAYQLGLAGITGLSVGFIPLRTHVQREGTEIVEIIDEAELLEISQVAIPSNPSALGV